MTRVAVLGASGFVGEAVSEALRRRGAEVSELRSPRISTRARTPAQMHSVVDHDVVQALAHSLATVDVVVVAAGIANAMDGATDVLYGANALLPLTIALAAQKQERLVRLVHVSSAGVQGRLQCLDETTRRAPFSPYTYSKSMGEELLAGFPNVVIFRPTSVHGAAREVTRRLKRLMRSRVASVAGPGEDPTPQVLVENVADAISFTSLIEGEPPPIVLQPWEGLTTAALVRVLGRHEPVHISALVARPTVMCARAMGVKSAKMAALSRRLEMLWFGQRQVESWLTTVGWEPVVAMDGWERLACTE